MANVIDMKQQGTSIDITKEVQHAFTAYFTVFGTKIIDFNPDVSAFKNIAQLIGVEAAEKLLQASEPFASGNKYKLVLFCTIDSERFNYEIEYDNTTGDLVQANTIEV